MIHDYLNSTSIDWYQLLNDISINAHEAIICNNFVQPLLKELGFTNLEYCPQFPTGTGLVDYAARKNIDGDIFQHTKTNPYLLVEVKGRQTQAGANVANAAFARIPAALTHKTAYQSYLALAKEYFLQ